MTSTELPAVAESVTALPDSVAAPVKTKKTLKEKLADHVAEYGRIAVITYLVLSLGAIIGFSIAFGMGMSPTSSTGMLGVIGAGWLAAKATLPIRALITLAITPGIAAMVRWRRKPKPPVVASELQK